MQKLDGTTLVLVIGTAALAAAACGGPERPDWLGPCQPAGVQREVLCGRLEVPEDRDAPTGRTVSLLAVVLPAAEPRDGQPPLFEIPDGPGASATDLAPNYAGGSEYAHELRRLHRHRDVVLVDARGSGGSGALTCAALNERPSPVPLFPPAAVRACLAELQQRANLTRYTTSAIVEDFDAVREALGYEQVDVLGFGWGGRAALEWARLHPERVRAVAVVGATTVEQKLPLHQPREGAAALDALVADCAADPVCAAAHPELPGDIAALFARLEGAPLVVSAAVGEGETAVLELDRDTVAELVRGLLYSPADARRLPAVVTALARGDERPFVEQVLAGRLSGPSSFAEGLYLSVVCSEDTSRITDEELARETSGTPFGAGRVSRQREACSLWPRAESAPGFGELPRATPVLVVSGGRDPVAPPRWGERLAAALPGSRHLLIPGMARDVTGLSDATCLDRLLAAFFDAASGTALDPACVSGMRPPPFHVEGAAPAGAAAPG